MTPADFYETERGRAFFDAVCAECPFEKTASVLLLGFAEPYRGCWDVVACPTRDCTDFLPFAPMSFQRILAVHALEYVPDPDFLIKEIKRVLAPEGIVVTVTPRRQNDFLPFQSLFSGSEIARELKAQDLKIRKQKTILFDAFRDRLPFFAGGRFVVTTAQRDSLSPVAAGKTYSTPRAITNASMASFPRR